MKLYKNQRTLVNENQYYREFRTSIGYIDDKEVDNFNGEIKVLRTIGYFRDCKDMFAGEQKSDLFLETDDKDDEWEHLSADTEELTKKERKRIISVLEDRYKDSFDMSWNIKKMLDRIES